MLSRFDGKPGASMRRPGEERSTSSRPGVSKKLLSNVHPLIAIRQPKDGDKAVSRLRDLLDRVGPLGGESPFAKRRVCSA